MYERESPLRWEDFTPGQRRGIEREISRIGKQTKSGAATSVSKLRKAGEKGTSDYSKAAPQKASRIEAASAAFKDKPISLRGAVQRRVDAFSRAISYARENNVPLPGAGWYVDHADAIQEARGGIPFRAAAAASAALSPGKDPKKDELPAFRELARLHHPNPETGEPHTVTNASGEPTPVSELSPKNLAKLATRAASGKADISSSSPTFGQAGRPHERMIERGIEALRQDIPAETANNPLSGPKTSSYFWSIAHAGEMTNDERIDYQSVAHHLVHGDPDQGMFMFSQSAPGGPSPESLLSPEHDTAEDTWMQSLTSGQDLLAKNKATGRSFSPAKRAVDKGAPGDMAQFSKPNAGLPRDARLTPQAAVHAFNNKATRQAAQELGALSFNQFGENINTPSVMVQEVSWTQGRRDAGGDSEFNAAQRQAEKEKKAAEKKAMTEQKAAQKTQPSLF